MSELAADGMVRLDGPEPVLRTARVAGLDPLTGLLQRTTFLARATKEAASAAARPALFVADLMRFRRLNEALGPRRADELLAVLAARILAAYPQTALAARVGDDEFAVIDEDDETSATRLAAMLEAPVKIADLDIHPRVDLGRAACAEGTAQDWLRRAAVDQDRASPTTEFEAGGQRRARLQLSLEADAHEAMVDGGLEPFYQPIVDLKSGRVGGFEALVRWRHPRLGLLHPEDFLEALEAAGLIDRLGLVMIDAAAQQLGAWRRAYPSVKDLSVNVNITSGEILRHGMVADVAAAVMRAGLPPRALKLELTEREVMHDPEAAAIVMQALEDAGVALAVDDFGMGYSSLSYLARLPLQTLKIDRYFTRAMATNAGAATIVRTIVGLGHDLGLQIVAEGVEDADMAQSLRTMGCHCGQGFAYARALPAHKAEAYLVWSHLEDRPSRPPSASRLLRKT